MRISATVITNKNDIPLRTVILLIRKEMAHTAFNTRNKGTGAIAWSVAMPLGVQAEYIDPLAHHILFENLVKKLFLRPFSADS